MDRKIGSENLEYRLQSKVVAVLDIISALITLAFHGYTILTQEVADETKYSRKNVLVPLTPVQLQLHGYFLVLAWIGIITVNVGQLLIGFTLFNCTCRQVDATKALGGSRTWIKTCIFILILLVFKLVTLYFMSHMGVHVLFSILLCILEIVIRTAALVIVMRYLHAVRMAFPDVSQIYYEAQQLVESSKSSSSSSPPKRNPVTDAVWF